MSIWQFNAAVKGYVNANTPKEKGTFSSEEEKDEMFEWLQSFDLIAGQTLIGNCYEWDGKNFHLKYQSIFWIDE